MYENMHFKEFKAAQSNFLEKIRKNRADLLLKLT